MRTLLFITTLLSFNSMAFNKGVDPSASLLKECSSETHRVSYYRCPFGFCYEVKYKGEFGESFVSSLSQERPILVGPNARKVFMSENLDRPIFILDEGDVVTLFSNNGEGQELSCN